MKIKSAHKLLIIVPNNVTGKKNEKIEKISLNFK